MAALAFSAIPAPRASGRVELELEYPPDGAVVNGSACGVFSAGRALDLPPGPLRLDVALVLDTSLSTIDASGADVNRNGVIGRPLTGLRSPASLDRSSDPGDSVLAVEVAAARRLLRGLDARRTRVTLVTFSGETHDLVGSGGTRDRRAAARTVEPLTFDHDRIDAALSQIVAREPSGGTHMAAGIDRATRELVAGSGADGSAGAKAIVFLTDGQPTLPYGPASERENVVAVLDAADRAARARVRIDAFAIGPEALEGPVAVVEMAARTGGSFTPVPRPGDLLELMREMRFTTLRDVRVRNATTDARARPFRIAADGAWIGFLKLVPGSNHIEISARSRGGATASRFFEVHLDPRLPPPTPLPRYVVQRNELLEICLDDERRLRVALEEKRLQMVGRQLRLEIERARVKASERAEAQRKALEIVIEPVP